LLKNRINYYCYESLIVPSGSYMSRLLYEPFGHKCEINGKRTRVETSTSEYLSSVIVLQQFGCAVVKDSAVDVFVVMILHCRGDELVARSGSYKSQS